MCTAQGKPQQYQELVDLILKGVSFHSASAVLAVVNVQSHVNDVVKHLKNQHVH